MSAVAFRGVAKRFGEIEALAPLDLDIASGEFVSLLGPSGSGKTTLLNICAGYVEPTAGSLIVAGRDITALPARRRNIGMVFQNYALFPHLDVFENVAYGLRVRKVTDVELRRRVAEALRTVQLDGFGKRAVRSLSGGQQQRVALARAMVIEPDILLMDEPLGALDKQLRKEVQIEIRRMHVARPRTTLYVTHDQEEALVMSDRIAVMRAGRVVQLGTAQQLYSRPADSFVARFLGESNLVRGRVAGLRERCATLAVDGLAAPIEGEAAQGLRMADRACALIRPENIRPVAGGYQARIVERIFLGEIVALRLALPSGIELWSRLFSSDAPAGDQVEIGWDRERVSILPEAS
ncbi:putative spermidine/putrescine transport system ATP-binding protein/spermidine/putrescine transport system ATP-binding protein [Rhizobiales bacterium GAS113]|nr:putative spermidine/putrescine transport system ATP-binding protein/spermidine/putrescine transport system ATP-binding protein [Rhizobiales bacterium GAS113]